jgi:DNA-binding PadR family transcriptional regulator
MTTGGMSFRCFVLGLLEQQSMSGYDIKRLLQDMNWLIGGSSFGNIYPTLHTLLKDGLVTVEVVPCEDRPSRKIYDVTEKGRQALRDWLKQPVPRNASPKAFVMRLILTRDLSQKALAAHLQQRRAQVAAHRDALEGMCAESKRAGVGWQLALDYGLALVDTELEWLDRASDWTLERFAEEVAGATRVGDVG